VLTALAGGVGAARLLAGLVDVVDPATISAIVNTGDDMVLHGLSICPDLDTVTYTLAGLHNEETGWGVTKESWTVMGELEALGGDRWFALGDRDLATHLYRTGRLQSGASLSEVTAEIAAARGIAVRLLPMSDDPVRTRLTLAAGEEAGGTEIDFQHYFVRLRHSVAVSAVRFEGAAAARPALGVLAALEQAETIVICPSNPLVSIGPILAVPGVSEVLQQRRRDVVAVSPIIAGAALKGPADRLLMELGHESSVTGVARLYRDLVGTLVIDEADATQSSAVEALGLTCVVAPTVMSTPERAAALARVVTDAR
jgi:LPPG:FO 2-phospho-L-lactate transferase